MRPDSVSKVAGKPRVVRLRHPISQGLSTIAFRRGLRHGGTERIGKDGRTSARVLALGIAFRQQGLGLAQFLVLHLSKKPAHALVILLGPLIVGMLVALGAGDAHAEKHLRGHRRHLARLGGHLIKETGRLVAQRAFGGEQFPRPLIERSVVPHGGADPLVISEGILVPEREAIDPQQVAPFERPEIGELSPPH